MMAQNTNNMGQIGGTLDTPIGSSSQGTMGSSTGTGSFTGSSTGSGSTAAGNSTATGNTTEILRTTGDSGFQSSNDRFTSQSTQPTHTTPTVDHSDNYQRTGREVVVTARARSRPSTAMVLGSVVAGAVAGGAIPFMLAGRKSGGRSVTVDETDRHLVDADSDTDSKRTGKSRRSWR